ncbi:hypothetical protein ABIE26_000210 [Pedobacter africanus]|uniref:Uncharacterized protein n=1 Tax=Pedobacter africanus TaxID=151894 RepID=A0ACC6KVV2_9SPHI|nr:hypothetical protein [Pedobacter africanus]
MLFAVMYSWGALSSSPGIGPITGNNARLYLTVTVKIWQRGRMCGFLGL